MSKNTSVIRYNEFYKFAFWNCLPQSEKNRLGISTQKDFAEKHGVDVATLSDWKKREEFWKVVNKEVKSWARELTPNVLKALYKQATRVGYVNPKTFELWLKYVEGWDPNHPAEDSEEDTFSLDDLNSIIDWLPEKEQREFRQTFLRLSERAREIYESKQPPVTEIDRWLEPQNLI
jgi:hypothetical protein